MVPSTNNEGILSSYNKQMREREKRELMYLWQLITDLMLKLGESVYQGSSPDEVALCNAAKQYDFVIVKKTNAGIKLKILGLLSHLFPHFFEMYLWL